MKQMKMAMAAGAVMLALSSCGQAENPGEAQTSVMSGTSELGGSADGSQQEQDGDIGSSADQDSAESTKAEELEKLTGEYTYVSDDGTGRLIIEKTSYGYDISDYESEASYRFLADSSNIEAIENNRIYLKYPEQVLSDGEAVFGYYILEYDTDGIDVYYGESTFEEVDFLYHSTRKTEAGSDAYGYEGSHKTSDVPNVYDESVDSDKTADELLDLFINGSISAADPTDLASAFYITDLKMDTEEWDSYSIGEKADLDNDGEDELILCGPYGGIYLDARNGMVYEFAVAEGTALTLSYVYYNGAVWIMYSSRSSAGFEFYHMEKYEGADSLVAEINFGEELVDPDHEEPELKYTWNGTEISHEEYTELCSKILATEVYTNS